MSSLRIKYQTIEVGDVDIHVRTLRDRQQYLDTDGTAEKLGIYAGTWSLFGVVWASSEVLANIMFDYEVDGKRILEIGCGIGLASLMLNHRMANITATDHHPEVESFLSENIRLNAGNNIPFIRTDWGDENSGLGVFDLLIGSDLLYEGDNVDLLAGFINQHSKPHCEVIIVDPGRSYHSRFSKKMVTLGYSHQQKSFVNKDQQKQAFRGNVLSYIR